MLKRNGCVYTQIVKNCSTNELLLIKTPLFELKLKRTLHNCSDLKESIIYSDTWVTYDGLVDYGTKAHYRIKYSKNEFVKGRNHINNMVLRFFCFISLTTINRRGYAKHRQT